MSHFKATHRPYNPNFEITSDTRLFSVLRGLIPFTAYSGENFVSIFGDRTLPLHSPDSRNWLHFSFTERCVGSGAGLLARALPRSATSLSPF